MCILHQPACRLCLTENISEPFFFLLENESHTEMYATLLQLQTNLYDASILPNHVCNLCKSSLDKFILLQKTSVSNEKFILKYQELIKSKGLKEAKIQAYFKEDSNVNNADSFESITITQQHVLRDDDISSFNNEEDFSDNNPDDASCESEEYEEEGDVEETIENDDKLVNLVSCKEKKENQNQQEHCDECNKDFSNLRSHIKSVHKIGNEKLDCPTCKKQFWGANSLKNHMICHDENRLECPKCPGKTFAKSTFVNHIREVHRVGKHIPCSVAGCKVRFRKKGDMVRHIGIVHENKKELCTECGESFKNLKYHQTSVHQGLRYKCQECDKEYKTEKMLKHHFENIHEMKRSICDICAVEVIDLKNHIKLNHQGPIERTESCPEKTCDRKFRTGQEARKHYKSFHLEIKEMCQLCGGWFKALYQHMLAVHKNIKKHVCTECDKGFSKKHDLFMHRNRVHLGIKYVCPHCGKQVSKLRDHIKLVHKSENENKSISPVLTVSAKSTNLQDKNVSHIPYSSTADPCQVSESLIANSHHLPIENTEPSIQIPNQTQSSNSQINEIIKRCVTNIDQQMSSCRMSNLAEGSSLNNLIESVDTVSNHQNSSVMTDFSVYTQLPSMHTVLDSDIGLMGTNRGKLEKDIFSNHRNQMGSMVRNGDDLLTGDHSTIENNPGGSSNLEAGDGTNLQVYQWLSPPM